MGLLDKIKNALFEVEYVEVEDPPKKEKKSKVHKEKEKKDIEKPIAKKIILPDKNDDKIEELQEEELIDQDFEIRPKEDVIKEAPSHDEFKFMDDKDFKVDDVYLPSEEPELLHVVEDSDKRQEHLESTSDLEELPPKLDEQEEEASSDYIGGSIYSSVGVSSNRESRPYGLDSSYSIPVHEYGTYERKEERTYFKPSPIISPIYGILDKNYRKEDVVAKKENHSSTSFSRSSVSVDDIRNKAYGIDRKKEEPSVEENASKFEVDEEEDNLLVDLSDRAKPEVKELTVGDAVEYFQDLGLEYNVDYVDVSTDKQPKKQKDKVEPLGDSILTELKEDKENTPDPVEQKNDKVETIDTDNDNLFDLIDSMYQEND